MYSISTLAKPIAYQEMSEQSTSPSTLTAAPEPEPERGLPAMKRQRFARACQSCRSQKSKVRLLDQLNRHRARINSTESM
jgi:hypothetical protein